MTPLTVLINLVNKANKDQLWSMIYDFDMIGFYREDKRQKRKYILDCLRNCYKTEVNIYGLHDYDSLRMERSILESMKY